MHACVGDRLVIKGHNVGDKDRDAEILEVRGPDGGPPFVVRWDDTGHETLFFPGGDATVQHLGEPEAAHEVVPVGDVVRTEHADLGAGVQRLLDAADALDGDTELLPDEVHEVYRFLQDHVLPHAAAEDSTLYDVVDELLGGVGATGPMRRQHVEIARLVERLGALRDESMTEVSATARRNLRQVLHALHANLSLHLATEEELYVPLLEARLSPRRSAALAEELLAAETRPPVALADA